MTTSWPRARGGEDLGRTGHREVDGTAKQGGESGIAAVHDNDAGTQAVFLEDASLFTDLDAAEDKAGRTDRDRDLGIGGFGKGRKQERGGEKGAAREPHAGCGYETWGGRS